MSTMVTDLSRQVTESNPTGMLVAEYGVVLIALLVVLLIQKEIMRAVNGPRVRLWLATLDVALVALVLCFGLMVLFRMVSLVQFA